jgi:hypothetical protein
VLSIIAHLLTAVLVMYILKAFWMHQPPDFHLMVGGRPVPAQTYPIVLVVSWLLSMFAAAKYRPDHHHVWWWFEVLVSCGVAAFIVLTILKVAAIGGVDPTYLPVLAAFLLASIGETLVNGVSRFSGAPAAPASVALPGGTGGVLPGAGPTHEMEMPVVFTPVYYMRINGRTIRLTPPAAVIDHVARTIEGEATEVATAPAEAPPAGAPAA